MNDEVVGHDDRGAYNSRTSETRCRDCLGQVIVRSVQHRGRRAVLLLPTQYIEARALRGIQPLPKSVENVRAELDCVGAAQLLNREANLKRVCESVDGIDRRDCDLRRDVQRPIDENAARVLGAIGDLQRPGAARVQANQMSIACPSVDTFQ